VATDLTTAGAAFGDSAAASAVAGDAAVLLAEPELAAPEPAGPAELAGPESDRPVLADAASGEPAGDEAELRMVFRATAWPELGVEFAGELLVSSVAARAPPPASSAASAIPALQRSGLLRLVLTGWPPDGLNSSVGQLSCGPPLGG
jgi:hypothetical protein